MSNEFELIEHSGVNDFFAFLVEMKYRRPHLHTDIEIIYVLKGSLSVISEGKKHFVQANDFIVINSCQLHELHSEDSALLLILQLGLKAFEHAFPQINEVYFETTPIALKEAMDHTFFLSHLFKASKVFFREEPHYALLCYGFSSVLMFDIMRVTPHGFMSEKEHSSQLLRQERIKRISDYIHKHYEEKLLLTDIAEVEQLSISYLSHFFRDNFGVSFREYLNIIRCEKARHLLINTKNSLLEICEACGFSDLRYLNNSFKKYYGDTPKNFREYAMKQTSLSFVNNDEESLDRQFIYSKDQSLFLLDQYYQSIFLGVQMEDYFAL